MADDLERGHSVCSHRGAVSPDINSHVLPLRGPPHPAASVGSNRPRRFRCVVASTWRRMDRAVPVVPLHGGVRAAAGVRPGRLAPGSPYFGGVQEPGVAGLARRTLDPRRVTGSGAGDGRQPAESPAVPRQGRRVPARVGDYMRTIDPIDLALTITISSMASPKSGLKHETEN